MISTDSAPMSLDDMKAEIEARRKARASRLAVTVAPTPYESTRSLRKRTEDMLQDKRTYKQIHGRCEDAPCCGCCGGTDTYY